MVIYVTKQLYVWYKMFIIEVFWQCYYDITVNTSDVITTFLQMFKKVLNWIFLFEHKNTNTVNKIRKGREKRLFAPYPAFFSVFDDEDENKLSYTDIHVQYKKLVSADICFARQQCPTWCLINITHHWVFGLHTHRPGLTKLLCLRRWRSC